MRSTIQLSEKTRATIARMQAASDKRLSIRAVIEHGVEVGDRLEDIMRRSYAEGLERGIVALLCIVGAALQRYARFGERLEFLLSVDKGRAVIRDRDSGREYVMNLRDTMRGEPYKELYSALIDGLGAQLIDLRQSALPVGHIMDPSRRLEA